MRESEVLFLGLAIALTTGCKVRVNVPEARPPRESIGARIAELMVKSLSCSIQSILVSISEALEVEIDRVEMNTIAEQVKTKKLTTAVEFWTSMEPTEATCLKALVLAQYDALDAKSVLRNRPFTHYADLLAEGLIRATAETQFFRSFYFGEFVKVSTTPERYEGYILALKLTNAGTMDAKSYVTCK